MVRLAPDALRQDESRGSVRFTSPQISSTEGCSRRSWRAENMAIRCAVHFIPFSWQKAGNSSMVKSTALLITL